MPKRTMTHRRKITIEGEKPEGPLSASPPRGCAIASAVGLLGGLVLLALLITMVGGN